MTTATSTATDTSQRRSKLNFLSLLCIALTSAFLTASVFLIFQYKQGIPFGFITSVVLAAAAALVIPVIAGIVFRRFIKRLTYPAIIGFIVANLTISIVTGLFIF